MSRIGEFRRYIDGYVPKKVTTAESSVANDLPKFSATMWQLEYLANLASSTREISPARNLRFQG